MRLVLRKAGILPAKPRAGCPALPTPAIGASGEWINRDEFLAAAEAAHAAGYGLAALLAFREHSIWSPAAPLPAWITRAICNGVNGWIAGATDSLTDAMGASLGNRKLRESTMRAQQYGGQMYLEAKGWAEAGCTIDVYLWEQLGARYGISASTAERTVRAYAKAIGEPLKKRQNGRAL
jgi:hypothetical protein